MNQPKENVELSEKSSSNFFYLFECPAMVRWVLYNSLCFMLRILCLYGVSLKWVTRTKYITELRRFNLGTRFMYLCVGGQNAGTRSKYFVLRVSFLHIYVFMEDISCSMSSLFIWHMVENSSRRM